MGSHYRTCTAGEMVFISWRAAELDVYKLTAVGRSNAVHKEGYMHMRVCEGAKLQFTSSYTFLYIQLQLPAGCSINLVTVSTWLQFCSHNSFQTIYIFFFNFEISPGNEKGLSDAMCKLFCDIQIFSPSDCMCSLFIVKIPFSSSY